LLIFILTNPSLYATTGEGGCPPSGIQYFKGQTHPKTRVLAGFGALLAGLPCKALGSTALMRTRNTTVHRIAKMARTVRGWMRWMSVIFWAFRPWQGQRHDATASSTTPHGPKPSPWGRKTNDTPKAGVSFAQGVKKPPSIAGAAVMGGV